MCKYSVNDLELYNYRINWHRRKKTYEDKEVIETTEFCGLQTFYKLDSDQHVEHTPNKADVHKGKLYFLVLLSKSNKLVYLLLVQLEQSAVELYWGKYQVRKYSMRLSSCIKTHAVLPCIQ